MGKSGERRVEGGAEVQQDGRAQSVAANGRGAHVCRWEVYLCMEMMFDSSYCTGTAGPGGR